MLFYGENWVLAPAALGAGGAGSLGQEQLQGWLEEEGRLSPSVFAFAAEAKAAEAAASAYYDPGNPHNVYMPMVSGDASGT